MMPRNLVVLVGSPRKQGNTDMLADAFIQGAQAAGHTVSRFHLRDNPVNGCIACEYCFKHLGQCVQNDGMQLIIPKLYQADTVVFASPVYYYAMSAQIKAVIDRFYLSVAKPFPVTSAALLLAYADTQDATQPTLAHYNAVLQYMGWGNLGVVAAGNVANKGDIAGHKAIEQAKQLGHSIALAE